MVIGCLFASVLPSEDLRALYDAHRWFELRQAARTKDAPIFLQGAMACVFNDSRRALRDLGQVIRSAPASDEAYAARELLIYTGGRGIIALRSST